MSAEPEMALVLSFPWREYVRQAEEPDLLIGFHGKDVLMLRPALVVQLGLAVDQHLPP